MRTLIGIAVVIGIFLTASVAVAKVYRCTLVKGDFCNIKACYPYKVDGTYFMLNDETGFIEKCGPEQCWAKHSSENVVQEGLEEEIEWLEKSSRGKIHGNKHRMSKRDGSWHHVSYRYSVGKKGQIIFSGVLMMFGFCH